LEKFFAGSFEHRRFALDDQDAAKEGFFLQSFVVLPWRPTIRRGYKANLNKKWLEAPSLRDN
jgi:hypothetical protein